MGEYVKYRGSSIKLGTCEDLFYTDYGRYIGALREGLLSWEIGNADPQVYARPGRGLRFRFPFPDEDCLPLGEVGDESFERGVLINIERGLHFAIGEFPPVHATYEVKSITQPGLRRQIPMLNPNNVFETIDIEIVQQKPVSIKGNFYLLLVYRCPYSRECWRIEHRVDIPGMLTT